MDNLTSEQRRKNMQNIRSKGTIPEKIIARELRRRKINFSQHSKTIIGKPDFVLRKMNILLFIDSDFWHGNPKRFVLPKTNVEYWIGKIDRNRKRDRQVTRKLKLEEWNVLRIWEYDVKYKLDKCINKILKAIEKETAGTKLQ